MNSYVRAFVSSSWLLGVLLLLTGALVGHEAAQTAYAQTTAEGMVLAVVEQPSDLGTLNPAFQEGNPTDEPGTIDNPVTEYPIDVNAQIALWLVILGFISSPIISFLNRRIADSEARAVVAFVSCLVLAVLDTLIRGTFNATNLTATLLLIFGAAITFYRFYFKPSGIAGRIEGRV